MATRSIRFNNLGELIRDVLDRLGRLERRSRYSIGTPPNAYVLEQDGAGNLTARNTTTGTVTVVASP